MADRVEDERGQHPTPLCDRLAQGPYPSHIRELQRSRYPLTMLEEGLRRNETQWGSGGYISMPPLLAGISILGSSRPEVTPEIVGLRLLTPPAGFMSPRLMRRLADLCDEYGDGHLRWTTSGSIDLPVRRSRLMDAVIAANEAGLDVGSTGDDVRNISACPAGYRCDVALVNAPDIAFAIGRDFIDDQQYPGLPNKLKTGVAGCPNDCVRAQMANDHSFVGVFRDAPVVDDELMSWWVREPRGSSAAGSSLPVDLEWLIRHCPGAAMERSGESVVIEASSCRHCMLCINKCPGIRPGSERGVAWVVGGKYGHRGANGPMIGFVLSSFIPAIPPGYDQILELYRRFLDLYADRARRKERVGDMLVRLGLKTVLGLMDLDPDPAILDGPAQKMFVAWQADGGRSDER